MGSLATALSRLQWKALNACNNALDEKQKDGEVRKAVRAAQDKRRSIAQFTAPSPNLVGLREPDSEPTMGVFTVRAVTNFCARAVGCSCPWGALARYPSVPAPCPCPLPFGARPMPAPFCGPYPFATRGRCVLLLVRATRSSACSYSSATPTRFVLLPVRYPRPPDARAFPLPVPAACPRPYSSVFSVALLRLRHHATSRARHGARAHERARGPRAATF